MNTLIKRSNSFPAFGNFFDDFFSKDLFNWNDKHFTVSGATLPSVNVKETDDAFAIELAAPGMKKEDFNIELNKHVLTISSEQKEEHEEKDKNGKYTRREFNYHSFSRSFNLPAEVVESEKIEAVYKDGILNITVPKKEVAKPQPVKTIAIQ